MKDRDISRSINEIDYDNVIHVSQVDDESNIIRRYSQEYYVKGIGLAEKYMEIFEDQSQDTTIAWVDRADKGFQMSQKLISFSTK